MRGADGGLRGAAHPKPRLLPRFPNVDDVVAITHTYGCGVAIDAPGAAVPIRTLRHISLHPNFAGQPLVVSLGCEKLQPARLFRATSLPVLGDRQRDPAAGSSADFARNGCRDHAGRGEAAGGVGPAAARRRARHRNWWWACSAAAATHFPA